MTDDQDKSSFELKPEGKSRGSLLLVHGLSANPSEVRPLAERLVQSGYYCYAPCLSGHDKSIEELKRVKSSTWVADVEAAYDFLLANSPAPHAVIGLSFGALLSLNLASHHSDKLSCVVSMSAPVRFRTPHRSFGLRVLSYLPDWILDLLPCVDKKKRAPGDFVKKRVAFDEHSVAAGARLVQVRKLMFKNLSKLQIPLLALYDPEDHHVLDNSDEILKAGYQGPSYSEAFFPGGQHELTLGKKHEEVFVCIEKFLEEKLCQES